MKRIVLSLWRHAKSLVWLTPEGLICRRYLNGE